MKALIEFILSLFQPKDTSEGLGSADPIPLSDQTTKAYVDAQRAIDNGTVNMNKYDKCIEIAESYTGVTETTDNSGPEVEEFQKAVDGKAQGEPWCLSFIQFIVDKVDKELLGETNMLYKTEHVLTLWNNTLEEQKSTEPKPGYIAIWRFKRDNKWTTSGHAGIVISIGKDHIITMEGNTGPDDKTIVREGDGVYRKARLKTDYNTMKLLGYINPWEN